MTGGGALNSETQTPDALDGVTVVGGRIQFEAGPGGVTDDIAAGGVTPDRLRELYDAGKFTEHLRRVLAWAGRKYDYKSLQVPESDQAFADACEVAYRRLADGPAAVVLQWIGNDLLVDIFVVAVGFGPVVAGVKDERRQKAEAKRMAAAAANAGKEPDNQTDEVEAPENV